MKKLLFAIVVVAVVGMVYYAFVTKKHEERAEERIRFVSLAWQEQTLAANRAIVDEWNRMHPEMKVEYVQGTWNSIYDYLITAFETGDVPDVFHYESSVIVDFAMRGYLTDLSPMIGDEMKSDILNVAWASVRRPDGQICGVPFLLESFIGLYNRDMFDQGGVEAPTFDHPWSWQEMEASARKLTPRGGPVPDHWGAAMGLRSSANIIMNMSIGFGGSFFRSKGGKYEVRVGAEERSLLSLIHTMLYVDSSMAPSSVGKSGAAMIPGFIAGRYAMLIGIGAWGRQQVVQNAPKGFRWGVIPPLKALTQNTGTSTQTLSIPKASRHKAEAMQFIRFMLNRKNMAKLALGDWMLPTRASCLALPEFNTSDDGWDITAASVRFLSTGTWTGAPGYVEWKSRVANPVLQEFFSGRLTLDEAAARIEEQSNTVLSRYQ